MRALVVGRGGVELSADPRFLPRVRRLAGVSAVALGVTWGLAVATLDAHPAIEVALLAGWILMPTVLGASLARPGIRRLVAVPAALVTVGLLAICLTALPEDPAARAGWILTTAGVLLGGGLGVWFWYRWFPVPAFLDDPTAAGRWLLIGIHVAPIVAGLALVSLVAVR